MKRFARNGAFRGMEWQWAEWDSHECIIENYYLIRNYTYYLKCIIIRGQDTGARIQLTSFHYLFYLGCFIP